MSEHDDEQRTLAGGKNVSESNNVSPDTTEQTALQNSGRRRFLGGAAALGVGAALSGLASNAHAKVAQPQGRELGGKALDKALQEHVKTVVVIYAENRSFNNLFGDFPGVEKPLSSLTPAEYQQRDRDGALLSTLPPVWGGVLPIEQTLEGVTYAAGVQYQQQLPNAPYALKDANGLDLPLGLVTRDLWHVFYQNQMQINAGKNDCFVAWADSGGLPMGHYAQTPYTLRLWDLAKEFVLCDNFFQGAFGGSFLNHHYLISATAPTFPDVQNSPARSLVATLQSADPTDYRLQPLAASPASAMTGAPQFGPSAITPDGYAVNTLSPPYWPTQVRDPERPDYAKPGQASVLPPQSHEHIGDKLSKKNIDWAWYAGAWQNTLDQFKDSGGIPKIPNFQYHHQPFNYFTQQGPQQPAERQRRLRDGGLGDEPATNKFFADAQAGKLPAVTFYKPQGNLNMHAGYADVASGDRHIVRAIKHLQNSPQWPNMLVVITVDENGGWWDHVAPPKGDRWGPGSRVPALVVSPFAKRGTVDHTVYDTASILRLITRVFQLEILPGLTARDAAMRQRGQEPMGDLTNSLQF